MSESIKVTAKKSEAKSANSASRVQEAECSQPANSRYDRILFLQKTIGNQAVQRLLKNGTLQAKLKIGQPGDVYEREEDRLAQQVMRMTEPQVQRQAEEQEKESIQGKPLIQLRAEEDEEFLQTKSKPGETSEANPSLESRINAIRSDGQPLPTSTRAFFETRFGRDFSNVRVHTDNEATRMNQELGSRAFAYGRDIYFGVGQYNPQSIEGKQLLGHELTHVVQQSTSNTAGTKGIILRMPQTLQNRYPTLNPDIVDSFLASLELHSHGSTPGPRPNEECFVEFFVSPNGRHIGPAPLQMQNDETVLGTASPTIVFNWTEATTNADTFHTTQRHPASMRIVRRGPGRFRATVRLIDPLGTDWREPLSMEAEIPANELDRRVLDVDAGEEMLRIGLAGILNGILDACRDGVDDFVTQQFAAAFRTIGSTSSSTFLTQLLGNTLWAGSVFIPVPGYAFVVAMAGITINMLPSAPRNFEDARYVTDVNNAAKTYFETIVTHLQQNLSQSVATYIHGHQQATFRSATIDFLRSNFPQEYINLSNDPGINPTRIRNVVSNYASDQLRGLQLIRLMAPSHNTRVRIQAVLSLVRLARQGRIDRDGVLAELRSIQSDQSNEEVLRRTAEQGIEQLIRM